METAGDGLVKGKQAWSRIKGEIIFSCNSKAFTSNAGPVSWMLALENGRKEGRAAVDVCELGLSASECDLSWDPARALQIQCHQESGHC